MTDDSALGNPAPVTSQAWVALWAATTAQVAVSVVMQGVPTLVPFIQRDLGLSRGQVGAFASALNVGVWVALSFTGWAVDTLGDRAVMTVGVAFTGVLSFVVAAASGFWTGVIGLVLTGLGGSTTTTTTDILWTGERVRRWASDDVRKVYYPILLGICLLGMVLINFGAPLALIIIGAFISGVNFVIMGAHTRVVQRMFLPDQLQPPVWRKLALGAMILFFAFFATLGILNRVFGMKI